MLPTSQGLKEDPSLLEDWKKDMDQMLVKAQGNQKRSSDRLVSRDEYKHPPSVYNNDDGVIVKLMKNGKKKKLKEKHLQLVKEKSSKDPITDINLNEKWVKIINPIGFLCL